MPGLSFDRVANIYDQSRGGQQRGDRFAAAIAGWLTPRRVVELGIGTGVVASGLRSMGHDVVGFDLSEAMLRIGLDRCGPVVARADVDVLPVATASVDAVYFVWVLHLVDDPARTLAEAARVVRPGGRVIALLAMADDHPDDEIAAVLSGLAPLRRSDRDASGTLAAAPPHLDLLHSGFTPWDEFDDTVSSQIGLIEQRRFSALFEVSDATWTSTVEPVLERLRELPDAHRVRRRINRHPLIVWTVTALP